LIATPRGKTVPKPNDLNTDFLESLLGYNARRASLTILSVVFERMATLGLRPVEFSMLSLIHHNPGVTSRRLSEALAIQPPNLVSKVANMLEKGWITRQVDSLDKRALVLSLTSEGIALIEKAEALVAELEATASVQLTTEERDTLIDLLKKVYVPI
jgi:DNA-binding MarR family transcriptional regulator